MQPLKVLGVDPSFSNWGMAKSIYDLDSGILKIEELLVVKPVKQTAKTVRQNSVDLYRAKQISKGMIEALRWADVITVEVPHGSQSARAMCSYGACIGILGCLMNTNTPFIQVNANETRHIVTGRKDATKAQAIAWGMSKHPEANWPMRIHKGVSEVVAGTAEHMADAILSIYAAMATDEFKLLTTVRKNNVTPTE